MKKDRQEQTKPVLEELRSIIRRSDFSQRRVEEEAGFSKGYLSQLLAQNLDLKLWHVLAILEVFDIPPAEFFETVFPRPRRNALERFTDSSEPLEGDIEAAVNQLYRMGVESLTELRMRLNRCEKAVDQLEARGVVHLTGIDFGRDLD